MQRAIIILTALVMVGAVPAGTAASDDDTEAAAGFVALRDAYLAKFKPLWIEAQAAAWEANIVGTDAAFDRKKAADRALIVVHSDRGLFAKIKGLKEGGQIADPVLARELDVMYRTFLPNQGDPALLNRIVELESDVEQAFNTHRSRAGDRLLNENEVRDVLANTTDSAAAAAAWKGYMEVGRTVEGQLRELVRLRNQVASQLGFSSYYSLQLVLQELDEAEFFKLFEELDTLTRQPYAELKSGIDAARAERFAVPVSELRPWHYGDLFFQEAPRDQEVDLDALFAKVDLEAMAKTYFAGLGLPCDDVLARSDLYERPGKCPHAFSYDLDRAGDVRILCNLRPNLYWADTVLHELGHAVYDKYIPADAPFLLHSPSHAITTEGIALMFGSMVKNGDWLRQMLKVDPAQADRIAQGAGRMLRTEKLMFSRWTQVMVHFEHGMYTQPDQDLAKLWWDLKRRYQLQNPPDRVDQPDYAAKNHVLTTPVYYHSYLMGEMFSSQVRDHLERVVLGSGGASGTCFQGDPKVGRYLRDEVFGPANLYPWNELTKRATGQPLTAKCFAKQFTK